MHGDCSRFFNATCELGIEPKELGKELDSISICLSKGLCAPVGSIVAGSTGFIRRFKANRKMMGGVMRKPGIVAGPALIAL